MFGWFTSYKSPVRRHLEESISVHRTWFEWTVENGQPKPTLVVELAFDTDPESPNFDREGLDEVVKALASAEAGDIAPAQIKLIPRMYGQ